MARNLLDDIQETLISAEQIQQRVLELGEQISADYANSERDIIFIGVLKGALMFMV
ncbi:MAG: hypoxanthine phosphoribosyltransferase, partial [Candidatus Chloroheliales bacterium]